MARTPRAEAADGNAPASFYERPVELQPIHDPAEKRRAFDALDASLSQLPPGEGGLNQDPVVPIDWSA